MWVNGCLELPKVNNNCSVLCYMLWFRLKLFIRNPTMKMIPVKPQCLKRNPAIKNICIISINMILCINYLFNLFYFFPLRIVWNPWIVLSLISVVRCCIYVFVFLVGGEVEWGVHLHDAVYFSQGTFLLHIPL